MDGLVCLKFGEKNAASASICAPLLMYYLLIVRSFHEVEVTEIGLANWFDEQFPSVNCYGLISQ